MRDEGWIDDSRCKSRLREAFFHPSPFILHPLQNPWGKLNMPGFMQPTLVLADNDAIVGLIVFLITVVGWVFNLVSNKNQKGPPVANRPRPPQRPRDEKLQQEINIFVEESGTQSKDAQGKAALGKKVAIPRPVVPAGRAVSGQPAGYPQGRGQATGFGQAKRKPAAATSGRPLRKVRPGETIAGRPAHVTDTLGAGVKQSLSQHMTDRVSQEVQQRLAPRIDENVAADLGMTMTSGASMRAPPLPSAVSETLRADRFAEMLRNPASVRQAIVLNLILSPPLARARMPRR